ncbi:MAG: hypothetical protein HYT31_00630 [Parcubacteria group bacterium]|nr:hypothetical protein [Parcubacteria group bacterium]
MKIKQHTRVALQSALATFFVALVVVTMTSAATTIGNNVSTGTVTATGIVDITASADTPLTVNGATSSTTFAVYNSSTGDLVNIIDGQTEVFTVLDGGNVGVASSTPNATLAVQAAAGKTAFMVGSTTAELLTINASGVTVGNEDSLAFADLRWEGDSLNNLFMVDASADRVGIGSSTPQALLSIGDPQANATSSIDVGLPCFRVKSYKADGTVINYYMWPDVDNTLGGWATSTTSCF